MNGHLISVDPEHLWQEREVEYLRYYKLPGQSGWNTITERHITQVSALEEALPIRHTNPRERIRFKGDIKPVKYYGRCLGPGTLDVPHCTDPSDRISVLAGLMKRLMPAMPLPNVNEIEKLGNFVQRLIEEKYTPLPPLNEEEVFEEWITTQNHYSTQRKVELRRAHESLISERKGLTEKDYWVKTFIKSEFYEEEKHVRWICSRTDRFKAKVAGFIKLVEERVYNTPIKGHKWFVKGEKIDELPQKLSKLTGSKFILETDYSSFESGFSPMYTDNVEVRLWKHMLKNNPTILDAVLKTYYQTSRIKLPVPGRGFEWTECRVPRVEKLINRNYHAYVSGLRMSGEMWTSLGNGFSNLVNILYIADKYGIDVVGYVEGDDGIIGMPSKVITQEDFEALGFKIKMEYEEDIAHTCFCGNLFDPEEKNLIIAPEQIGRLMWTCDRKYVMCNDKIAKELLKAKAMSMYILGRHTPIASHYSFRVMNILHNSKERHDAKDSGYWKKTIINSMRGNLALAPNVTNRARCLYQTMFHITIEEQLRLEGIINRAKTIEDMFIPYAFIGARGGNPKPFYLGETYIY